MRKAAEQGVVLAQYNLGVIYANGTGVVQDAEQAAKWYRRASEKGYGKAQFNLGTLYFNGEGVIKDLTEAFNWYREVAEQGNELAQNYIGVMYAKGQGVAQDDLAAYMWFSLSAAGGLSSAGQNRDNIAKIMTPAQIEKSKKLAKLWMAENLQSLSRAPTYE